MWQRKRTTRKIKDNFKYYKQIGDKYYKKCIPMRFSYNEDVKLAKKNYKRALKFIKNFDDIDFMLNLLECYKHLGKVNKANIIRNFIKENGNVQQRNDVNENNNENDSTIDNDDNNIATVHTQPHDRDNIISNIEMYDTDMHDHDETHTEAHAEAHAEVHATRARDIQRVQNTRNIRAYNDNRGNYTNIVHNRNHTHMRVHDRARDRTEHLGTATYYPPLSRNPFNITTQLYPGTINDIFNYDLTGYGIPLPMYVREGYTGRNNRNNGINQAVANRELQRTLHARANINARAGIGARQGGVVQQNRHRPNIQFRHVNNNQNVHDSGIISTLKQSINKLQASTKMDIPLTQSLKDVRALIMNNANPIKQRDALSALNSIERNNSTIGGTRLTLSDSLNLVWNRINQNPDEETRNNLKESLINELSESVEKGSVVCTQGKFVRIFDTLNVVDKDVKIVPKGMIKQEMLNRASKIRNDIYGSLSKEEKDAIESINQNDRQKRINKLYEQRVKNAIKDNLKREYVDNKIITQSEFNNNITSWINTIF